MATEWNPGAPDTIGEQTFFTEQGDELLAGGSAVAVAMDSTSAETIDTLEVYIADATSDASRLIAEIFEEGDETGDGLAISRSTYRPNQDVLNQGNAWVDSDLTTDNLYAKVNSAVLNVATWVAYFAAAAVRRVWRMRFNTDSWPVGRRVLGGRVKFVASREEVNGRVEVYYVSTDGSARLGEVTVTPKRVTHTIDWPEFNPVTKLPWTRAEIRALDSTSSLQFRTRAANKAKVLRIFQISLELDWVPENRVSIGVTEVDEGATDSWLPFTLLQPDTGNDNWAKANGQTYTILLRRLDGAGTSRWRWLAELRSVARLLLRPRAGAALPHRSYQPTIDGQGFVIRLGEQTRGRAPAWRLKRTDAVYSTDGQPYTTVGAEPIGAIGDGHGQTITAPLTTGYGVLRWMGDHSELGSDDLTIRVTEVGGAMVDEVVLDVDALAAICQPIEDATDAGALCLYEHRWAAPLPLTGGEQYLVEFGSPAPVTIHAMRVTDPDGELPSFGGDVDGFASADAAMLGDAPVTLATVIETPADFALAIGTEATGHSGVGCTIASIDRVDASWTPTVLGDRFGYYELQRLARDGETWHTVSTPTSEVMVEVADYEQRRDLAESYRLRVVRDEDYTPSDWTDVEVVTTQGYGADFIIASNHLQAALPFVKDGGQHEWDFPRDRTIVALAGVDGRLVMAEAERRGDDLEPAVVIYHGTSTAPAPPQEGREAFEPLINFLRSDVPHFAVIALKGWRHYGYVDVTSGRELEPGGRYRAELAITETQFEPTPFDPVP